MTIIQQRLGDVLLHIYEFPFEAAIYFPDSGPYNIDTPCIVGWGEYWQQSAVHEKCLNYGLKNWLNVAVVTDTFDSAPDKTEACLVAQFNKNCREGGSLSEVMNYWGGQKDSGSR